MHQITGAIIATTLVTVAIYVPIAFFGGMVGNIYMQFSVTMCVALCLSAINSLTLSPALCVLLLKRKQKKQSRFSLFRPFNASLEWARKSYIKCAGIMVRRAWLTLILLAAVLVGNWKLFETVPKSFLPPEDKGTVFCDIQLAPGATLGRTEQAMRSAEQKLMSIPGVRQVSSTSGFSFMGGNGENLGMCIAQLDPWDKRKTPELSLDSIMQKASVLCDEIPAAKATVFSPPAIMGLGLTGGVSFMLQASGEETPKDLERVTNDLLDKIKQIRAFIAAAPQDENTGNLLSYLSELEKDVNGKKYGLVFEEHREEIDEVLDTHTPVLTEDADLFIDHGGQMNFLLEGDNLAALKLLEKTHRGKIDLIYIDPPYNRGKTDFVYDDDFVVNEDTFRHSKWISFMKSRLEAAKRLLTEAGLVFISIDDNEVAALKLLCDEVFGADFFINLFVWQRNSSAKTEKGKFTVNTEYVLLYAKSGAYTLNSAYKPLSDASQKLFKFDDNDGRGKYQTVSLQKPRDPGPETTYDYADNTGKVLSLIHI